MRRSLAICIGLASALSLAHCQRARAEKNHAAPPYVAHGSVLAVRADLFDLLEFERVTTSTETASVTGLGRVSFLTGGGQAVRAPTAGFVERVLVGVGDTVRKGQPLATLRSMEVARLRADVERLSALIAGERSSLQRVEFAARMGGASEREVVDLRAKVRSLEAERTGASGALLALSAGQGTGDKLDLLAPAAGQVLRRSIMPGERVSAEAAESAFLIGDASQLCVRAAIPERHMSLVERGAACAFEVPALGTVPFVGRVAERTAAIDPRTQTGEVACAPTQLVSGLLVDMGARVRVQSTSPARPSVPRSAVLFRKDARVVFVKLAENRLERRNVVVGASLGDRVEIIGGVVVGESVASRNVVLLDGELDEIL